MDTPTDPDTTSPETEAADTVDAAARHDADRPPTPDEERRADEVSEQVDVDEAGEHFREMSDIGTQVKGEGAIDPQP